MVLVWAVLLSLNLLVIKERKIIIVPNKSVSEFGIGMIVYI